VSGRGVALLPSFIAGPDLRQGTLRSFLAEYQAPPIALYAIYPPTRHLSVKVRLLIDFLVQRFGDTPTWDSAEEQQDPGWNVAVTTHRSAHATRMREC
jgi:DNA-binding transcriptional LysR family regulator